jgi:cell division protease FtsH
MSEVLGPVNWGDDDGEPFLGRQFSQPKHYSDDTARRIDEEVKNILERAYEAARTILTHNIHVLHRVAQSLIERESLDHTEFAQLVEESGPVPPRGLAWMGI